MTPREKLLVLARAIQSDAPRGYHLTQDPERMDTETLFVVVLIALVLLYNQTASDGSTAIDVGVHPGAIVAPPIDPGPPDPPPSGPPIDVGQTGNADFVAQAIGDLERAGRSTQGPCGALAITNLVAWRLRPRYGLLRKSGGNRAVPQADGSCLGGDVTSDAGYATDYLIDRATFYGFDILHDGGGANGPGWDGPETDFIERNRDNFAEPFDPQL